MIYDIVLNFAKTEESYDFFEWDKKDLLTYIEKIPIIKINTKELKEIVTHQFQISKELLKKIENKTFSSNGILPFTLLITDGLKVMAFSFDEKGIVKEKSNLLPDEEDAVILESEELKKEKISYHLLKKYSLSFLTRKEQKMQKILLNKIEKLYEEKKEDEIDYLYQEYFSTKKSVKEEYQQLIENIKNHFEEKYESLYEIIQLAER